MTIGSIMVTGLKLAAGVAATSALEAGIQAVVKKGVDTGIDSAVKTLTTAMERNPGNYVKATQAVRVEPFTLIDQRAARYPNIKDVLNTAQKLFTAYYLMAVAADNTIEGIKVSKYLDRFAPDRSAGAATLAMLSTESYQFGLPFVGEAAGLDRYSSYCSEAALPQSVTSNPTALSKVLDASAAKADDQRETGISSAAATAVVKDIDNLAVGQIVDVTIEKNGKKATLPVQIRLRTIGAEPHVMKEILALGGEDRSRSARLRKWRVGEISMWRDLVMNQDYIDRYRQAAMADKSGYFRSAYKRANKGLLSTLMTGETSVGVASSIAITTRDTIRDLEMTISGRIDDFATRQQIFDDSLMMLLFVIDTDHDTVTLYTRDIEQAGVYAMKDLKGGGKSNDLTDIMKMFMEGRVPGRL
ncbi:hypothetical protein D3C84_578190 [compost metagenome]